MHERADILDQRESLRGPFVQSMVLHAAVFGALIVSTLSFQHNREVWGGPTHAGDAVAVNSVKNIPLPSRTGTCKSRSERHRFAGAASAQAGGQEAGEGAGRTRFR